MFKIKYTTNVEFLSKGFKTKQAAINAAKKIGYGKFLTDTTGSKIEIIEEKKEEKEGEK